MPRISVVIPSYNASAFIGDAYESLANQTISDIELIFVDDCSTDDTRKRLYAIAKRDARVQVLTTVVNGGPSGARNVGFAAARGEFIAILDADDVFTPNRLETLLACAVEMQLDIVADNMLLYDIGAQQIVRSGFYDDGRVRPYTAKELFLRDQPGTGFYYGWLQPMFRRSFLLKHGLRYREDLRHGEDFHFVAEWLLCGAAGAIISTPMYRYTLRVGELSGVISGMSRSKMQDTHKALEVSIRDLKTKYAAVIDGEMRRLMDERVTTLVKHKAYIGGRDLCRNRKWVHGVWYFVRRPMTWTFVWRAFKRTLTARLR